MCFMTCDALPLGLLTCHHCVCCIHTPIAHSPHINISGGFRGGRAVRAAPLKFAKHMLYNVN